MRNLTLFNFINYIYQIQHLNRCRNQGSRTIRKNLVLCNHSICNYKQLLVISNYVLSSLQLITIIFNLLLLFQL